MGDVKNTKYFLNFEKERVGSRITINNITHIGESHMNET